MFKLKTLKDINIENKRVLIRVDFNVPLSNDGKITDDFRIAKTIPTIEYLINKGAKIILMTHFGRPKGKRTDKFKTDIIQDKLFEYLDYSIIKAPGCIEKEIKDWTEQMQPGEILLLENLRFYPGEEKNNLTFAKKLAQLGDIYVNEAFGASHRNHASIVGVPKFLPSVIGFLFEKEIEELNRVLYKAKHPLVIIIGGAKPLTKVKVINKFLKKADKILLGGVMANTIFAAAGLEVGKSLVDKASFGEIKKINLNNPKLILPIDLVCKNERISIREIDKIEKDECIFDIGPKSVKLFSSFIKTAKTIVWNGPLGLVEEEPFDKASGIVARLIAKNKKTYSIIGGGDTVGFINQLKLADKYNYVSIGGGAMLEYLVNETLPGIEALRVNS